MKFLAIDPGANPGYAVLDEKLQLVWCGTEEPAAQLFQVVLCEDQTIYPKMKVPPADIITLAHTAGDQTGIWRRLGAKVVWVEPRSWKGNIPKHVHHAATVRVLSPSEQGVVSRCLSGLTEKRREDPMDAVALAVYGRKFHIFR